MRPAFSSTRQAAAFAALLLILLALPLVVKKSWLPSRDQVYAIQNFGLAPLPYIRQQIFEEKGDIDIAFVGSSHMLHGIDTPYVQQKLSEELGRPAVVRSFCWGGPGFDILYLFTQDLLLHRHVRLLVFYDEDSGKYHSALIPVLFQYANNVDLLSGLPVIDKAMFYYAAIRGIPRNLLMLCRPEIPAALVSAKPNYSETFYRSPNPALRLGSISARGGFKLSLTYEDGFPEFVPFTPPASSLQTGLANFICYGPTNQARFNFINPPLPAWQVHFARLFAALAQTNGCHMVLLHLPVVGQMRSPVICEREFWPSVMQSPMVVAGIPEGKLFAGLSDSEVLKLFLNPLHLNANGEDYFTKCITPGLMQIYESQINH
jgi:hypothetical protein